MLVLVEVESDEFWANGLRPKRWGVSRNDNGIGSTKYYEIDHIDVFDKVKGAKLEIVTTGILEYKPGSRGCMVVFAFAQLSALEMVTAIAMKLKESLDGHEIELRMRS